MRKTAKSPTGPSNLDSLVDIVSNNVGILIILAAFMALVSIVNPSSPEEPERQRTALTPPRRLLVPWSHPSNKNAVLFMIQGNRVRHFDMRAFFKTLASKTRYERPRPTTVEQEGLTIRFFPVTNQIFCLEFDPERRGGETWLQANGEGSRWREARARYGPDRFYYFFWVAGDSFELFHEVRKTLQEQGLEVGWKPVAETGKLEMCSGFEGSTAFQPQ